jgi:hypothetical protein
MLRNIGMNQIVVSREDGHAKALLGMHHQIFFRFRVDRIRSCHADIGRDWHQNEFPDLRQALLGMEEENETFERTHA